MRVMTFNCNGIRAAERKGFFSWLADRNIDCVCLQETKAQEPQLRELEEKLGAAVFHPAGFHCHYFDAEKKGYSGTAVFCRKEPLRVRRGFGFPMADSEGRYLQVDYEGLSVISLYLPSGSAGEERQRRKFAFMDAFMAHLRELRRLGRENACEYIVCGDWNICHKPVDLKNWRSNQKNSGFLPEERAWLDTLYDEVGFVDAFRHVNREAEQYTWWSQRGMARANNVGWRLDLQVVTPGLADKVKSADIIDGIANPEQNFSDHAPMTLEYDLQLD